MIIVTAMITAVMIMDMNIIITIMIMKKHNLIIKDLLNSNNINSMCTVDTDIVMVGIHIGLIPLVCPR